jgi:hypothetical protein
MGTLPAIGTVRSLMTLGLTDRETSDETWNPLRLADQLQEAILIDVLFDITASTVGVLLDLNNALELREGAVGLLVVRGVDQLRWSTKEQSDIYFVWTVLSSAPTIQGGLFQMVLGPYPDAKLTVTGKSAEFYEVARWVWSRASAQGAPQ